MIYGESGTGKDIIAKEIHKNSINKDGPFIILNAALTEPENLEQLTNEGSFRKDLFHRLNVVTIKLPNLSERSDDIDSLIDYFTEVFSKENNQKNTDLKPLIKTKYINYDWPGNIRELRNVIERYSILGEKYDDNNTEEKIDDFEHKNVISLPLRNARKLFEKNYLQSQINRFDGNISKTAAFIGMERSALHRKLKQLGITEGEKQ